MWTPWGGWAPMSHPLAASVTAGTTTPAIPSSGMSWDMIHNLLWLGSFVLAFLLPEALKQGALK